MLKSTCQELSEAVQRVLSTHGTEGNQMTLKAASERSGVSLTQIHKMSQGIIVGCEDVMEFADAFDETVEDWLRMCGHHKVAAIVSKIPKSRADSEFETLLMEVPAPKRPRARKVAVHTMKTLIVPLFTDSIPA